MHTSDKYLLGIVFGLIALVVVAFVVVRAQKPADYVGDRTAEDAARDYLLALERGDHARAYGLLSPELPGYPSSLDAFVDDVFEQGWRFGGDEDAVTVRVEVEASTPDSATVMVNRAVFRDKGLFDNAHYGDAFRLRLKRMSDGSWRIAGGERFVSTCWTQPEACERHAVPPVLTAPAYP